MDHFSRIIKSKIVRIGNSQGVRIPHFLLQQLHLANEVEMSIQDDQLVFAQPENPVRIGKPGLPAHSRQMGSPMMKKIYPTSPTGMAPNGHGKTIQCLSGQPGSGDERFCT